MSYTRNALLLASALALAVTTAPLQAQQPSAQPGADATPVLETEAAARTAQAADEAKPAKKKKERRICKAVAPTGTRIAKKTCLTQAQWDEAQRVGQDATNKAQTSALMINKEGG